MRLNPGQLSVLTTGSTLDLVAKFRRLDEAIRKQFGNLGLTIYLIDTGGGTALPGDFLLLDASGRALTRGSDRWKEYLALVAHELKHLVDQPGDLRLSTKSEIEAYQAMAKVKDDLGMNLDVRDQDALAVDLNDAAEVGKFYEDHLAKVKGGAGVVYGSEPWEPWSVSVGRFLDAASKWIRNVWTTITGGSPQPPPVCQPNTPC